MFLLSQFPLKFKTLEPFVSDRTIEFHYGKHLDAFIKNLNSLIPGTQYENLSLEEIIKQSSVDPSAKKIFNNAAQVFNHDFFFRGMALDNKTKIPEEVAAAFSDFNKEFSDAAMSVFGSGWVWLVRDEDKLKIETTANADTPIAHGRRPLLALDVWEHAYYLDYQNRRAEFVDAFINHLIDWDFVREQI